MTQRDFDAPPANKPGAPVLRRVANLAAHLMGGAALAFGAVNALAKRDKNQSNSDTQSGRESRREERRNARQDDRSNDDRAEQKDARQERREARDDQDGRDRHGRHGSADREQRAGNNNNNNNNNDNNSDSSNSSSNNDSSSNNSDGNDGGNGHGNAGSGFFDSPLASKARRRANDFDNNKGRDDEPKDDHLTANTDEDGHHFQTNSISFTNGPDGLEVVTRNIEYSAPPTPTPTPFPTLTLPERDRLDVFGDRVIAAPTASPADNGGSSGSSPPPSTNGGTSGSTGSRPTPTPAAGDTSGGDNTSDFLS